MAILAAGRNYIISGHALREMERRQLNEHLVRSVLAGAEQEVEVRPSRIVLQSRVLMEKEKPFLIRVFVDVDRDPAEVVTAYRTSKISKYWMENL